MSAANVPMEEVPKEDAPDDGSKSEEPNVAVLKGGVPNDVPTLEVPKKDVPKLMFPPVPTEGESSDVPNNEFLVPVTSGNKFWDDLYL